jgi:hypothetical protein
MLSSAPISLANLRIFVTNASTDSSVACFFVNKSLAHLYLSVSGELYRFAKASVNFANVLLVSSGKASSQSAAASFNKTAKRFNFLSLAVISRYLTYLSNYFTKLSASSSDLPENVGGLTPPDSAIVLLTCRCDFGRLLQSASS